MKVLIINILFSIYCLSINAQVKFNYSSALKHFESQVGTWKADNSLYRNENEPMTSYVIEWKYGELKNSVYGKLYGLIDSINVGTFWEFHQYWNPNTSRIEFIQISGDGTIGSGSLIQLNNSEYELIQLFTNTKNETRYEKHSYLKPNANTELTSSFEQDKDGNWIKKRTYTWVKI
ncbi:MAG: hypothetical protein ACO1G9_15480 [Bacteroidota bacterium]